MEPHGSILIPASAFSSARSLQRRTEFLRCRALPRCPARRACPSIPDRRVPSLPARRCVDDLHVASCRMLHGARMPALNGRPRYPRRLLVAQRTKALFLPEMRVKSSPLSSDAKKSKRRCAGKLHDPLDDDRYNRYEREIRMIVGRVLFPDVRSARTSQRGSLN
jgi:hypothetical protein